MPDKKQKPQDDVIAKPGEVLKVLKRVYSSSVFYTIVTAIEALVPFLLTPILTRFLVPYSYGIWTLFVSFTALFRPIVSLSFNDAIRMHYYELDKDERAHFTASALMLSAIVSGGFAVLAVLFKEPLAELMRFPADWIVSIIIAAFLFGLFYFLLAFNQFANDRKNFAFLHIVQTTISFTLITTLVLIGMEWQGAILGKIIGLALCFVIGIFYLTPNLDNHVLKKPRLHHMGELGNFGLYYLPTGLGLVLAGLTDRLIIAHVMGVEYSGYYGVAELFGAVLALAINGFIYAWMPWLFQHLRMHDNTAMKEVYAVSLIFFLLVPLGGLCVYGASIIVAPLIIGEAFSVAFDYIPWAIAAMATRGFFAHNQAFLHFKKKILFMSVSSFVFIILNIVVTFILIYDYGIEGVFAATCISYFAAFVLNGLLITFSYAFEGRKEI